MDTTNANNNNHDDTTTTEYDSGGSEGVDYAYEGKPSQAAVLRRGSIESSASQRRHGHGHGHGATTTTTRKERSPKRRTSPPRGGKSRNTPPTTNTTARCVCGAAARDSDTESATSTNTSSSESDTEDEDRAGKRISGLRRSRASGGHRGDRAVVSDDDDEYISDRDRDRDRPYCDRKCCRRKMREEKKKTRKYSTNTTTSSSARKTTEPQAKKKPYIEEYPEEIRPVVLLKEHKLPRGSFSSSTNENSNSKRIRSGTDDHQQMSSSLGKIQTLGGSGSGSGKRPSWPSSSSNMREEMPVEKPLSTSSSSDQQQHHRESRRRRRTHGSGGHRTRPTRHEVPGGRFSGSELDDFDSDSDSGDHEIVHERTRRPTMIRRNSRTQQHEHHQQHTERGAEMMPSAVSRSSAARNHSSSPKYSSSWPLQRASHYDRDPRQTTSRQHRIIHEEPEQMSGAGAGGYESGDESDDIFTGEFEFDETTHRRKPRRPPSPPPAASLAPTHHHRHHHHHSSQQQHVQQQVLHRQTSQHLEPIADEHEDQPRRRRPVKPPRPPVARTVVSHRPSMGALDQGIDGNRAGGGAAYAPSTCDIWRGRPEDWESPYSSSSDHDDDDYDDYRGRGDDAPAYDYGYDHMMLLEGDRQYPGRSHAAQAYYGRSSSPQLLPPRRSGDLRSVFSMGFNSRTRGGGGGGGGRDPSPVGTHFSRRSTRTRRGAWDAADEHGGGLLLAPPAPSTRGGGGGRRRAPSRAGTERSRWTVMVPEYNYEEYGYLYGDNDYGVAYSPPPAPEEEDDMDMEGYYSYGFGPSIRVQAPSPPFPDGGTGATSPPPLRRRGGGGGVAMTEEEEMAYGYGRASSSGGLLSPVPTRTVAARFNFDKSWSELSRLLL